MLGRLTRVRRFDRAARLLANRRHDVVLGAPPEMPAPRLTWSRLPIIWAGLLLAAMAVPLSAVALPWTDLANNLSGAAGMAWSETFTYAFRPAVEYRPLLTIWIKLAYETFGLRAWLYYALLLLQYGAVLALLLWLFRPIGTRRGIAAVFAVSCLVGLHSSRALLGFVPVGAASMGVILLLLGAALALEPPTPRLDWLFLPLTAAALLLLESGIVIVPLVLVLLVVKAPGVSWRGAVATLAAAAGYMALRRMGGGGLPAVYTETGLGFGTPSVAQLSSIFEHAPWMFWLYNWMATLFTVLFSEPRQGAFVFVQSLLAGGAPWWLWLHVLSSTLTTALIVVAMAAAPPFAVRDRRLIATGLVLLVVGSGLGFLYTRDRIALTAGVGYVVLAYVAIAHLLERFRGTRWRQFAVASCVALLAAAWTCRTVETCFALRDAAWDVYMEWQHRYGDEPAGPPGSVVERLRVDALRRTPADPRSDPAWTYRYFQRQF